MADNTLYYGDNLDVLRRHVPDESVDLVYLDPPFNSQQDYNVLFQEQDGTRAAAQILAFGDSWKWDQAAARAYQGVVESGGKVSQVMQAFRTFLGENDLLAYLSMMAPRLVELRRVLKETGSIYLHCDPTASHYLKMLLDAVFGPENYLNEIIWKRTGANNSAKRFGPVHDTILFYARTNQYKWNQQCQDQAEYIKERYTYVDEKGRSFYPVTLHAAGTRNGSSGKPWHGIDITAKGGHWKYGVDTLNEMDAAGNIYWPKSGIMPRLKMYADNAKGAPIQDNWTDIPPLNSQAAERLGYPTQKPEALLDRIVLASSNQGDVVLDPFCGCGTSIASAQRLGRNWLGIDITHLSIALIKHRLASAFGEKIVKTYSVIGEPVDAHGAEQLAADDPYQFQFWALGLVNARPVEQKKGADKGIDGRLYFHDEGDAAKTKSIIFSVKAGHTGVAHLRDLRGVVDREKAAIGVLITLEEPTKPMRTEAASAGFYKAAFGNAQFPKLQVITVGELLNGGRVDMPGWHESRTFKRAPKAKGKGHTQHALPFDGE